MSGTAEWQMQEGVTQCGCKQGEELVVGAPRLLGVEGAREFPRGPSLSPRVRFLVPWSRELLGV